MDAREKLGGVMIKAIEAGFEVELVEEDWMHNVSIRVASKENEFNVIIEVVGDDLTAIHTDFWFELEDGHRAEFDILAESVVDGNDCLVVDCDDISLYCHTFGEDWATLESSVVRERMRNSSGPSTLNEFIKEYGEPTSSPVSFDWDGPIVDAVPDFFDNVREGGHLPDGKDFDELVE